MIPLSIGRKNPLSEELVLNKIIRRERSIVHRKSYACKKRQQAILLVVDKTFFNQDREWPEKRLKCLRPGLVRHHGSEFEKLAKGCDGTTHQIVDRLDIGIHHHGDVVVVHILMKL